MLLDVGGQDATEPFEDVGHSDEAREILDGLLVGNLKRLVCCFGLLALCLGLPFSALSSKATQPLPSLTYCVIHFTR